MKNIIQSSRLLRIFLICAGILILIFCLMNGRKGTEGTRETTAAAAGSTAAESAGTEAESAAEAGETAEAAANGETGTAESGGAFSEEDLLEQEQNLNRRFLSGSGYGNGTKRRQAKKEPAEETEPAPAVRPVHKDRIVLATDLHYYPASMTDYGAAFEEMLEADDGKDIPDISEITDSWIDGLIEERPATVVLSGDLTLNGESAAHRELAARLSRLTKEGIQVLVIPGNHDISNPRAAVYRGAEAETATSPDAEEFVSIYHAYGYDQAAERDTDSLSYLYKIDGTRWLLMLDSAIYDPDNEVGGAIRPETLVFMEHVLQEAEEAGASVIPVAHHNLLSESRLYTEECTLRNRNSVTDLLEKYHVKLWLSGHLHLQRIKKFYPEPGAPRDETHVTEAVTASFAMYPFRYAELHWDAAGKIGYEAKNVQVSGALKRNGQERFRAVIEHQVLKTIGTIPEDMKQSMAASYAELLSAYVAGEKVNRQEYLSEPGSRLFEKFMAGTDEMKKVEAMLADTAGENLSWLSD